MITLNLNGKDHQLDVTEDMPLLWAIRDVVGYTGTKFGCGMGLCGSCTIHIDGQATRSCITPVSLAQGRKVTTIDHLHTDKVGEVVQQAWLDIGVAQCGYCQGGQIMSATALLKSNPAPSDRADRGGHGRQHLPLRHLQPDQDGDPQRLRQVAGGQGMKRSFPDDLVIGNLSRRGFLKGVGATGVLLVAANWGWRDALAAEKKAFGADAMPHGWVDNPKIYVSIDRDGTVGIVCNRSEMGQGVRTSLAMVVADELEADWSRVKVIQAPGDEARYGNQDTDGSRSMRHWFEPMRRCGAAARQMLEQAAANQWKVPLGECRAEQNKVLHAPSGRSLSFGELAGAAAGLEVPARDKLLLKKPEQFRYIGKDVARAIDGADIVNGRAGFGFDARFDDMLYAVVARPPVYGGKLKRYDAAAALKVPGVVKVIEIEGRPIPSEFQPLGGVAVVAQNTWAAIKGRGRWWSSGTPGSTAATTRWPTASNWKRPRASRARWCATAAMPRRCSPGAGISSRPSTTCRTWPRRRWNRRSPPPGTRTAPARSGPRPRRRK